jgi:hypothetical protein
MLSCVHFLRSVNNNGVGRDLEHFSPFVCSTRLRCLRRWQQDNGAELLMTCLPNFAWLLKKVADQGPL